LNSWLARPAASGGLGLSCCLTTSIFRQLTFSTQNNLSLLIFSVARILAMGEGEEIAEQFLRYPSMLNSSQLRDYEELYHPDFEAILPSVS
jgi:hypothetical protein